MEKIVKEAKTLLDELYDNKTINKKAYEQTVSLLDNTPEQAETIIAELEEKKAKAEKKKEETEAKREIESEEVYVVCKKSFVDENGGFYDVGDEYDVTRDRLILFGEFLKEVKGGRAGNELSTDNEYNLVSFIVENTTNLPEDAKLLGQTQRQQLKKQDVEEFVRIILQQ